MLWRDTCAFTIASWNNWGFVEIWMRSMMDHNPHLRCVAFFVADGPHEGSEIVSTIHQRLGALREAYPSVDLRFITIDEVQPVIPFDAMELAFRYDIVCFNTAIKPWVFKLLFARGYERVFYFDPDCHFFSHLDLVQLHLHSRSFVVTPHETWHTPEDGQWQRDLQMMRVGIYNYGFVALSTAHEESLRHHLHWWGERLRYQGYVDLAAGMHFDQNWAVFIPSLYPMEHYAIITDPRLNVAYWNLHYRGAHISYDETQKQALYGSAPLVWFHFSGILPTWREAESISKHQTRFKLAMFPRLRPIFRKYIERHSAINSTSFRHGIDYEFNAFSNGVSVPFWLRDMFGESSLATRLARKGSPGPHPPPEYAASLSKVKYTFNTTEEGKTVWNWLFLHRYDHVVGAEGLADYVPNVALALLTLIEPGAVENLHHPAGPAAIRRWLYAHGVYAATYLTEPQDLIPGSRIHGAYARTLREALSAASLDELWDRVDEPLIEGEDLQRLHKEPRCHPVATKLFKKKPFMAELLRKEMLHREAVWESRGSMAAKLAHRCNKSPRA